MNGICLRSKWGTQALIFLDAVTLWGMQEKNKIKRSSTEKNGIRSSLGQRTSYGEQETVRVVYFPPHRGPSKT